MDIAYSINNIPIRLTREKWIHITENHDDLAGYYDDVLDTIENPDLVIQGYGGALIAIKSMERKRYLGVNVSEIVQVIESTKLLVAASLCLSHGIMECWNSGIVVKNV